MDLQMKPDLLNYKTPEIHTGSRESNSKKEGFFTLQSFYRKNMAVAKIVSVIAFSQTNDKKFKIE